MPAAIIFDFNGVLVWDSHLHEQAWCEFARRLRGSPLTQDEIIQYIHGRTNRTVLEYVLSRDVTADEALLLGEAKEAIYREQCPYDAVANHLSPGAVPLLNVLRESTIPYAIATSSGLGNMMFYEQQYRLQQWFAPEFLIYDDGTVRGKPAPDLYLRAAQRLQTRPAHCMVVEDSVSGIESARAAGIGHIVALGPTQEHARLHTVPGVANVINSLAEIDLQMFQHLPVAIG
ncbi:HAD family phosphatase [Chitinivorax sp. B]|uniref:HAD family hydrolase n=1 Tax=Chitinivorax sp. B TaxID=2502235 RepID=UPI0014851572|nr:HAD family phosphatase [Chitinivorax sp. B]